MISIYLESIPGFIEGEDVLVKYAIYNTDDELLQSKKFYIDSVIPLVSDHAAFLAMFKHLKVYNDQDEIIFFINNASLFEQLHGHSTIQRKEAIEYCEKILLAIQKFKPLFSVENVSTDYHAVLEWKKSLDVF